LSDNISQHSDHSDDLGILLKPELLRLVPLGDSAIRQLEKRNLFPRRFKIGAKKVCWLRRDIYQWIEARHAAAAAGGAR
jgi:predicted DNA-binding transcriptional regulator AlpA